MKKTNIFYKFLKSMNKRVYDMGIISKTKIQERMVTNELPFKAD